MPLTSAGGIYVVEKNPNSVVGSTNNNISKQQQQSLQTCQLIGYYDPSDDNKPIITNNSMRRHQRTISSSSPATASPSSSSVQHINIKNHQVVLSNTSNLSSSLATQTIQNYTQMNQNTQQQQTHHHQHHHQQQQQSQQTHHVLHTTTGHHNSVIVSDEYIEQAAAAGANVINISSNDLISSSQLLKLVTDGNNGNVLIDACGNVTTTNGTNASHNIQNSKVLVGNLTVLPKSAGSQSSAIAAGQPQQQHQTISFMNPKNVPSYITQTTGVKGQTQTVQKMINMKTNNVVKSAGNHSSVHHVTTNALMTGQPVVQKVTVPRSVQLVTRLPNMTTTTQQAAPQPQHIQQHCNQNQIVMQQKFVQNVVTGTKINSNTTNMIKKQAISQTKLQQHKLISTQQHGVKTFIQQQPSQQQPQQHFQTVAIHQSTPAATATKVKSQKIIKQYNNVTNSGSNISVATIQQQSHTNLTASAGTYTINTGKLTNLSIQQQPTKITKHTKYVMQNPIVMPSISPSQNQNKMNSSNNVNSIIMNQQLLNSINNSNCGNINTTTTISSSTIKFVNTHGTVIQQQQQPVTSSHHSTKVRTSGHHVIQQQGPQQTMHVTTQSHPTFTEVGKNESGNNVYHISTSYIQNPNVTQQHHQQQAAITDDTMIVNGIQMTDEVSARILQSMAQKSYSNQRYQQQPTQKVVHRPLVSPTTSMPPPAQVQHSITGGGTAAIVKEYPVYNANSNLLHSQTHHRQVHSTPSSRSQSIERSKVHDTTTSMKKSSEYFKVNSNEILQQSYHSSSSSSTTLIDNIPLPTYTPQRNDGKKANNQSAHEQDEDIVGEEIRPTPVTTLDIRSQILHAVLQDHTYVAACPSRLPVEPTPIVTTAQIVTTSQQQQQQSVPTSQVSFINTNIVSVANVTTATVPPPKPIVTLANITTGQMSNQITYTMYGQQIPRPAQDDDANSVISNGSRTGGMDNDLGEETETAPEAEAEDDSITRCICDLTHDDGYMICCDKCSAWQHVDCMGIDRQNIPDEYLCEICQPRVVDKARAKSLQLIKRKEILLNAQLNAAGSANTLIPADGRAQSNTVPQVLPPVGTTKKGKLLKRKELIKTKGKKEKSLGKRRETKKPTKRKTKNTGDSTERFANTLRTWIENYEDAVTNHYSPELRARLHAISKQPALLQSITSTENKALKNCGSLEQNATEIPHAGGKILISNFDVEPNKPIMELRGKFLLTTQYKNQNPSVNIPSPANSNLLQSPKVHKNAGPFVFFYQLPGESASALATQAANNISSNSIMGPEICVDTRTYGSQARFVRRSCRPNAIIQHSFEKGTVHLYIVSLTNIMASTEITIKHEPHDLIALDNKKMFNYAIQPTSTNCACGLTKDCLFGVPPQPPAPSVPQKSSARNKNLLNGSINKSSSQSIKKKSQNINRNRSTSSSGDSNTGILSPNNNNNNTTPNIYNSTTSIVSLMHDSGVYTSSSSPSVSIPSPTHTQVITSPPQQVLPQIKEHPLQQQPVEEQQPTLSPAAVQVQPSVETAAVAARPQIQPLIENVDSVPKIIPPPVIEPVVEIPPPVSVVVAPTLNIAPLPMLSPKPLLPVHPLEIVTQELKSPAIEHAPDTPDEKALLQFQHEEMSVSAQMCQEILHSKFPTEEQLESQFGQQAMKSPHAQININCKKSPSKQPRMSMSEDSNSQQALTSPTPPQTQEKKRESRKLTREERKMEAIVKAFEKMEKNQQRKQELKQSKCPSSTTNRRNSNSPSPKRVKLPSTSDNGEFEPSNTSYMQQVRKSSSARKKKRKGYKAYAIPTAQRKRRKSRMNSNESDAMTSEESTSMLSPPIKAARNCLPPGMPSQQAIADRQMTLMNMMEGTTENNVSQAAGLLLAFAKAENQNAMETTAVLGSPTRPEKNLIKTVMPPTPPAIVSSTCLLVEAAVGPLENLENICGNNADFKLPSTTKTKKTLMSTWLNQTGDYQYTEPIDIADPSPKSPIREIAENQQPKGIDSLVQATMCDYRKSTLSPSFMTTKSCDEPQNVSMVAKKVEEFINQTDINNFMSSSILAEEEFIKSEPPVEIHPTPPRTLALPIPQISSCSNNSSVKKRWLRQAISEETTDDNQLTPTSASPTSQLALTSNGFTTPLKKRRLLIKSVDEETEDMINLQDLSLSKSCSDSSLSNEAKDDLKEEIKQEMTDVEDEVDILRSPSPGQKIVVEDNQVKIEPEDIGAADVNIDVEREESNSEKIEIDITTVCTDIKKEEELKVEIDVETTKIEVIEIVPVTMDEKTKAKEVKEPKLEITTPLAATQEQMVGSVAKHKDQDVKVEKKVKTEEKVKVKKTAQQRSQSPQQNSTIQSTTKKLLKSENNFENENISGGNVVADEMADIQKRLHSFHTENIMILQSRNKSSKTPRHSSDSKLETPDGKDRKVRKDKKSSLKIEDSTKKPKSHKGDEKEKSKHRSSSKKRQLNFDSITKESNKKKGDKSGSKKRRESSASSRKSSHDEGKEKTTAVVKNKSDHQLQLIEKKSEALKLDERHIQAALTIPNFNQPMIPPTLPIGNFLNNSALTTLTTVSEQSSIMPPMVSPPSTRLHLPFYNTIYGKAASVTIPPTTVLADNPMSMRTAITPTTPTSSNILLPDYLDTKAKSYGTLGGYVSHSAFFGLNTNKSPENGNSSISITSADVSSTTQTPSTPKTTPNKILTKTASSDPRLNPILTAPEPSPTPKRKLSINEYRKRKLQSTETSLTSPSPGESSAKSSTLLGSTQNKSSYAVSSEIGDSIEKLCDIEVISSKMDDTSNVQFSPAPTLLEKQQENLSERLKSLKNISNLGIATSLSSTTIESTDASQSSLLNFNLKNDETTNIRSKTTYDYDNSLEAISSSSTSPATSRSSTPERSATPIPPAEVEIEATISPAVAETSTTTSTTIPNRDEAHMHDSISSNEDENFTASASPKILAAPQAQE